MYPSQKHFNPFPRGGFLERLKPPLKATASASIRAVNVPWAALTNTSVVSARGHIPLRIVIFVVNASIPVLSPQLPSPTLPTLPTPVRVDRLSFLLKGYTHSTVEFLISGFTHGFPIHFQGERQSRKAKNLLSALDNPAAVDSKLRKELEAQLLAAPFKSPPLSTFWISPLGVVPKKVPGEFRLIRHLSFPKGSSVNHGIPPEHTSVQYATIDGAIELIKRAGPGCFLAKTDIKKCFSDYSYPP